MNSHSIFYYPYCSFEDKQAPLLKVAALYFDKLYVLDPVKATGGTVGIEEAGKDVVLLEREGYLERIAPEDVLKKYEKEIEAAVRADIEDKDFLRLCETSGRAQLWRLALAKIPAAIRSDPKFQPLDQSMQRLMRDLPRGLGPELGRYNEMYVEVSKSMQQDLSAYSETPAGKIEYRYADYPLPLGESIMVNHALFAGLLHMGATPLTDDRFHNQALDFKIRRASALPEVREIRESRAAKQNLLAISTLTDTQLNLPIISPQVRLEDILVYRSKHADELQRARERLGWLARQIEQTPWSKEFEAELEHKTIPGIAQELEDVKKARDSWLKSQRGRLALKAAGIAVGLAATTIALVFSPTPLLPVAVGLVSSTVIPSFEFALDWRDGKSGATENGLHYLLDMKVRKPGRL